MLKEPKRYFYTQGMLKGHKRISFTQGMSEKSGLAGRVPVTLFRRNCGGHFCGRILGLRGIFGLSKWADKVKTKFSIFSGKRMDGKNYCAMNKCEWENYILILNEILRRL